RSVRRPPRAASAFWCHGTHPGHRVRWSGRFHRIPLRSWCAGPTCQTLRTEEAPMSFEWPVIEDIEQSALAARLQHVLDNKTKPVGSLGRIETLAQRIGLILGSESPVLEAPQLVVFAADHGLAARGVSAYPSDVTWQMVENFLAGGAAVSVLARQHGIGLTAVDCGVRHEFAPRPGLVVSKQGQGTADALAGPAMTAEQCTEALEAGVARVRELPGNALLLGEMGIGNTSAASMLLARL